MSQGALVLRRKARRRLALNEGAGKRKKGRSRAKEENKEKIQYFQNLITYRMLIIALSALIASRYCIRSSIVDFGFIFLRHHFVSTASYRNYPSIVIRIANGGDGITFVNIPFSIPANYALLYL